MTLVRLALTRVRFPSCLVPIYLIVSNMDTCIIDKIIILNDYFSISQITIDPTLRK